LIGCGIFAIGIFDVPIFDFLAGKRTTGGTAFGEKALERFAGHVDNDIRVFEGVGAKRLGRNVCEWVAVGAQSLLGFSGEMTEGVNTGAGGFDHIGGEFAGDGFRHGTAASVAQANKQDPVSSRRRHEEIVARCWQTVLAPRLFGRGTVGGELEEMFVDCGVAGEFGMKGSGEDVVPLHERGIAVVFCEDFNSRRDLFDDRAADENHFQWVLLECGGTEENVAGELAAVGVAKDGHVEELEGILRRIFHFCREKDGAGAGAEDGTALVGEFADGVVEAFFLEELELRGAFATREDEAVATPEVGDGANFDGFGAEFVKPGGVGGEVSLDGEDADFHEVNARSVPEILSLREEINC
jgi:hypothetical protein